jgi:[acyl-carrier-protein] S-malonyltransferase
VTVAAWVDGEPVTTAEVEARLAVLRERDLAGALPAPESREGRQLRRWVTQVAVVERLCLLELRSRGLAESYGRGAAAQARGAAAPPRGDRQARGASPSPAEAAALGSIVAAAWRNHPAVPRAAAVLTESVTLTRAESERAARLGAASDGTPVWSEEDLLASARMEAFSRWLATAAHGRVFLERGYEHPGDTSQPDNVHQH